MHHVNGECSIVLLWRQTQIPPEDAVSVPLFLLKSSFNLVPTDIVNNKRKQRCISMDWKYDVRWNSF